MAEYHGDETNPSYVKFNNGLLIQWGVTSGTQTVSQTLPISYSGKWTYQVTGGILASSVHTDCGVIINNDSESAFTIYKTSDLANYDTGWIAIGY